jgi:hypothetical protein
VCMYRSQVPVPLKAAGRGQATAQSIDRLNRMHIGDKEKIV